MKRLFPFAAALAALFLSVAAAAQPTPMPRLTWQKGHPLLLVDGKPYLILGGQCGNSSNWPGTLPGVWETMRQMNANTLEIPVYWEEIEPVRGKYDFSSVQRLLDQAREQQIRLVLLWFATWKNGSNHYMPEWMKLDSKQFPNIVGKNGKPVDSPSPHTKEAMALDARAFAALMQYLKDADPQHTVIMVQVENEPGAWDSVRDYAQAAEKLFAGEQVPAALLKPDVLKELGGTAKKGTWSEVFGARADEYFHAWHVASYIGHVAAAGKAVNPLPLYVNAALRDPLTNPPATQYESGGPTDNVIAIYKAAAPAIDLCAPDIYLRGDANYMTVIDLYSRPDNALFVPETSSGASTKYLYEVLRRGIGFAPFGVDRNPSGHGRLAAEYRLLRPIVSDLAQWAAEGRVFTAIEPEDGPKKQTLDLGAWQAVLSFGSGRRGNAPAASQGEPVGKAMVVKFGEGDFLVMGTDVHVSFLPQGKDQGKAWHFLRVEEGCYDAQGQWVLRRVLNGDETDWQGPYLGTEPGMLRIRVYARDPRK